MEKRSSGLWVGAILVLVVAGIGYRYQRQKRIEAEIAESLRQEELDREIVREKRVNAALAGEDDAPARAVRECGGMPARELGLELDAADPQTRSLNETLAYWTFAQDAGTRSPQLQVGNFPVRLLARSSGWHSCLAATDADVERVLASRDGGTFRFEPSGSGVFRVRAAPPSRLDDEWLLGPPAVEEPPTRGTAVVFVPRADVVLLADAKVKGAVGHAARLAAEAVTTGDSELQPLSGDAWWRSPRGWEAWKGPADAASRAAVSRFARTLRSSILNWKLSAFAALQSARGASDTIELREVADVNHETDTSFTEREEASLDPSRAELMMEGLPVVTYECIPECPGYSLSWKAFAAAPGTVATPIMFDGHPLTGWSRVRRTKPVALLGGVSGVKHVAARNRPEMPAP